MSTKRKSKTPNLNPDEKKNPVTTDVKEESVVKQLVWGEYHNFFSGMMHPVTTTWIENEAKRIMEWSMRDDALRLYDYTDMQGYTPDTYDWLVGRHPKIKEAHDFAMRRIASRRETGAMNKIYSDKVIAWTQAHYCPIFKAQQQEAIKMKDEQNRGLAEIIVNMSEFQRLPGPNAPGKVDDVIRLTPEQAAQRTAKSMKRLPAEVAKKVKDSTVKGSGCRSEFKKKRNRYGEVIQEANEEYGDASSS